MAKVVQNITSEAFQKHTILFGDSQIFLKLRFFPRQMVWLMDVTYGTTSSYGYPTFWDIGREKEA